jgi:hypothetical protein
MQNGKLITSDDLYPVQRLSFIPVGAVYLVPVSKFPMPQGELQWVRGFCESLMAHVQRAIAGLQLEVIIKQSRLYTGLVDHFADHAPMWLPQQGVAVIPHLPPPHVPTRSEIESIDPRCLTPNGAGFPPDIVPELVFQIADEGGREEARRTMGGHGALSVFLSRLQESELHQFWNELFGKRVTDRLFRTAPLFIPLFGTRSFQNVAEDEITAWLESFELFIGESVEDNGIIVVARESLDVVIANLIKALPKRELEPESEILRW